MFGEPVEILDNVPTAFEVCPIITSSPSINLYHLCNRNMYQHHHQQK